MSRNSNFKNTGNYHGSATAFKKVLENGGHQLYFDVDGSIQMVERPSSRFRNAG